MARPQIVIANDWIRYIEAVWWSPDDIVAPIELPLHVQQIIRILEKSYKSGNKERVWSEIERLQNRHIRMENFDAGIALKTCGIIALRLENISEAEALFRQSQSEIGRVSLHYYAVITWMEGVVNWLQQGRKQNNAISSWQEAINYFSDLAKVNSTHINHLHWYQKQIKLMKAALEYAIENRKLPDLYDDLSQERPKKSIKYVDDLQIDDDEEKFQDDVVVMPSEGDNFFEMLVVYDEIPAGLPAPITSRQAPLNSNPMGIGSLDGDYFIEVTRVRIGDREYRLQTLKGKDKRVSLVSVYPHYVLKVKGNSMNQANIQDGDFVVMRKMQFLNADDGDIVAAEIFGVDQQATLKRLEKRKNTAVLKAESSDPDFEGKEWEFPLTKNEASDGFRVWGVAVAVLKPI